MADDLIRRAADMLVGGATLLAQPCPYCSGVRVLKDGHALCVGCGREPERRDDVPGRGAATTTAAAAAAAASPETRSLLRETLDRKVRSLTTELERETDHGRQQEILNSLNSLLEALDKVGGAGGRAAGGGNTPENKK